MSFPEWEKHVFCVLFFLDGSYNIHMKQSAKSRSQPTKKRPLNGKTTVFTTASVVTVLSVFKRGLGFLYRIVLSRLIGAEGVGLHQIAYSVFSVFLTIGAGGLPVTLTRFICKSKAEKDAKGESGATAAGLTIGFFISLALFLIFFPLAKKCSFLFSDDRATSVFQILLISLVIASLYSVLRGNLLGNKRFFTVSLIEIVEESLTVIAGVILLKNANGALDGANRSAWAIVIAYLVCFAITAVCFLSGGGKLSSPKNAIKPLLNATIPVTSVRVGGALVNSAVAVLLPVMLVRTGLDSVEAIRQFGAVSGMATPILFLPATIIGSLTLVLAPELSGDFYAKRFKRLYKNVQRGLCVAFLVACALLPFFHALGDKLGALAFSNLLAGELISKGCVVLLPMSLCMMSTTVLNSMGFEKKTFLFHVIGEAVTLLCVLLLPKFCGVYAFLWGLGLSNLVTAVCNLLLLHKSCPNFFRSYRRSLFLTCGRAFLIVLPTTLIGKFAVALLFGIFGEFLALLLSTLCIAFTLTVFILLSGLVSKRFFREKFQKMKV